MSCITFGSDCFVTLNKPYNPVCLIVQKIPQYVCLIIPIYENVLFCSNLGNQWTEFVLHCNTRAGQPFCRRCWINARLFKTFDHQETPRRNSAQLRKMGLFPIKSNDLFRLEFQASGELLTLLLSSLSSPPSAFVSVSSSVLDALKTKKTMLQKRCRFVAQQHTSPSRWFRAGDAHRDENQVEPGGKGWIMPAETWGKHRWLLLVWKRQGPPRWTHKNSTFPLLLDSSGSLLVVLVLLTPLRRLGFAASIFMLCTTRGRYSR